MTLTGSAVDAFEEIAPLASPTRSRSTIPKNGYQVRRRLAFCLFLYIAGMAIILQIYPKVSKRVCAYEYLARVRRGGFSEIYAVHDTHLKNANKVIGSAIVIVTRHLPRKQIQQQVYIRTAVEYAAAAEAEA